VPRHLAPDRKLERGRCGRRCEPGQQAQARSMPGRPALRRDRLRRGAHDRPRARVGAGGSSARAGRLGGHVMGNTSIGARKTSISAGSSAHRAQAVQPPRQQGPLGDHRQKAQKNCDWRASHLPQRPESRHQQWKIRHPSRFFRNGLTRRGTASARRVAACAKPAGRPCRPAGEQTAPRRADARARCWATANPRTACAGSRRTPAESPGACSSRTGRA